MPEVADLYVTLRALTTPFTTAIADAGAVSERAALQFKALQTEVTATSRRFTTLSASSDKAAASMLQLNAEADGAAVGLTAAGTEARTAAASLTATATSATEAGAATEAAGAKAAGFGSALGTAAKWGALALAGVGVASVVMASKFDAAITKLNTQAGVSKDKLAGLKDGVLQLAGQVGFSPDSLAEALFHVESNFESMGITSAKALELTKVAAQGAAVGHADLVDVTNALTAAVAAQIPGVEDLNQAMGILNATVGIGDMTMQDLAAAFGGGMVATVKGFGLSISDVAAGLAVFGDNNIRGANAGTQLRMSVMALANPVKGSADGLKLLGLQYDTLAKDMQRGGLKLALEDLSDRMKKAGIDAKEQGQIVTEVFGRKAGAGLNVLLDQMDRLESKYPALAEGADKFGAAWETTKQTLNQQFRDIEHGVEAAGIRIGEVLIPYVSKSISTIEAYGGRTVKYLGDLWDIYGPAVEQKLASGESGVAAGTKTLLGPLKSGLTDLAVNGVPIVVKVFDRLESKLTEVAHDARPVVDGLRDMYDSATSSGGALDTLVQRLKAGATILGGLTVGLGSATALLRPLGELVGGIAHAFSELPGPVQLSVLSMIALRPFRPQIQQLQDTVTGYGRSARTAFQGIGDSILYQRVQASYAGQQLGAMGGAFAALEARSPSIAAMGTAFRNTASSIEAAGGRLVGFRSAIGGLSAAAGSGLMSSLKGLWGFLGGPWGVAISGAMMGLDMLAKHQQQAAAAAEAHRQRVSSLASALKDSGGVITANVRATVAQTLADAKLNDGKTVLVDTMHRVGINLSQLTDAYMGQGSSIDALRAKIAATADENVSLYQSHQITYKQFLDMQVATKAAADALGPLGGEYQTSAAKAKELAEALAGGGDAARQATTPVGQLKTMLHTLADTEASADDKANALHQSLKLLSGGTLDVQAAVAQQNTAITELNHTWQDSLDTTKGYANTLLNLDGSLSTTTENGQALFQKLTSLRDQTADTAKATYDYARASGVSLPDSLKQAQDAMQKSWEAAVRAGQEMGLTTDQAQQLAAQMGLIPSNLDITLGLKDLDPTKAGLMYVQGLANHLKEGATIKVSSLTDDALQKLHEVGVTTQSLPDGTVRITVPTADVMAKLYRIINTDIPDKHFNITASFQSRFLDAGQAYADGGLVKRFADGGVLRAADGMTVPGYAPRRDIVPALLSPGEGVLVPEAVRAIGGARAISTINRAARSGSLAVGASSLAVGERAVGGTTVIHHTTIHVHGSVMTERELKGVVERSYLRDGAANPQTYPAYKRG
jgi:TP901 family phage tail tape measure protein